MKVAHEPVTRPTNVNKKQCLKLTQEQIRSFLLFDEQKNYKAALSDYQALQKLEPENKLYKELIKKATEKLK